MEKIMLKMQNHKRPEGGAVAESWIPHRCKASDLLVIYVPLWGLSK